MWVECSFARCKNDRQRLAVEKSLKECIEAARDSNTLWTIDWKAKPLASRK